MEQTSDEILLTLKSMQLPDELMDKLRELLSVSYLVKFAKYQPMTDDNEKALVTAQEFVDETKEEIELVTNYNQLNKELNKKNND
jgi:hypothetical protein